MAATRLWECKISAATGNHILAITVTSMRRNKRGDMIARIWHGWTKPEKAKAYEDTLRDEISPISDGATSRTIEARNYSFRKMETNRICDLGAIRSDGGGERVRRYG